MKFVATLFVYAMLAYACAPQQQTAPQPAQSAPVVKPTPVAAAPAWIPAVPAPKPAPVKTAPVGGAVTIVGGSSDSQVIKGGSSTLSSPAPAKASAPKAPVMAPPLPAPVPEAQVILVSTPSVAFAAICKKGGFVCWSALIDQYSGQPPFMAAAEKVSLTSNPPVYTVFTGYGATKDAAEKAVEAQLP